MADMQLDQFMSAIRRVESGGNYRAQGPKTKYGRASGAYQFLDSTWGGFKGYKRAMDAPEAVQDERARQLMSTYYKQFGDWKLVAVAWHAGPGAARKAQRDPGYASRISDVNISTAEYARRVTGGGLTGAATRGVKQATSVAAKATRDSASEPFDGDDPFDISTQLERFASILGGV